MNLACPVDLLHKLATDKENFVRIQVAQNTSCAEETLWLLANDDLPHVRTNVGKNLSSPIKAVVHCLPCFGNEISERIVFISEILLIQRERLFDFARSGEFDLDMICAGGETLHEGLINGRHAEISHLLLAEQLAGKVERLVSKTSTAQYLTPSRRI